MSLGTNLYLISQDKELMEKITRMVREGKEKYNEIFHPEEEEDIEDEESLLTKLSELAHEAKVKMEEQVESVSRKVYEKMHIAHTSEIAQLKSEIEALRGQLDQLRNAKA